MCVDPVGASDAEVPASSSEYLNHADEIATITRARSSSGGIGGVAGAAMDKLRIETEAADFANYFYSYAELDHQKQMLEDERCVHCLCLRACASVFGTCLCFFCMCRELFIVKTRNPAVTGAKISRLATGVSVCFQFCVVFDSLQIEFSYRVLGC